MRSGSRRVTLTAPRIRATSPPRNVAASLRARHWPACPQPSFLRSRVHRQERARCHEGRDDEGLRDDGSLRFCQELFRCAQRSTRDDSVVARNELLETLGDIRCERSDGDAARTLLLRTVAPRATRRYTGGRAGGKAETTTGLRGA